MADVSFFELIGLNLRDFIAGAAGGTVNAFIFQKTNPVAVIGSVVVGAFTANYLTEATTKYLGTGQGASSFIVGLCAMAICQGIFTAASKWSPATPKGGNGGT